MVCPNCKKELIAPGRFCGYCGAPLDIDDDDKMKTVMADDDIVTEELPQTELGDSSAVEERTTLSTQNGDSNQTVELEHAKRMREEQEVHREERIGQQESEREPLRQHKKSSDSELSNQEKQEKKTSKRQSNSKKRQKKNSTERLIPIMAAIAAVAVVVVVLLAARLILTGKNNNWIAQLSELKSTQSTVENGTLTDYQLDGEFERMSIKATIKPQATVFSADDQKLLQVWIDDSLVYELEEVQDEKEDWTFAIDLRGVDTVRIFISDGTKLEDVQVIRQSAQKETEAAQENRPMI